MRDYKHVSNFVWNLSEQKSVQHISVGTGWFAARWFKSVILFLR